MKCFVCDAGNKMKGHYMAEEYFPYKVSVWEFIEEVKLDLEPFAKNMENLKNIKGKQKYPEEWMRLLTFWGEYHFPGE